MHCDDSASGHGSIAKQIRQRHCGLAEFATVDGISAACFGVDAHTFFGSVRSVGMGWHSGEPRWRALWHGIGNVFFEGSDYGIERETACGDGKPARWLPVRL